MRKETFKTFLELGVKYRLSPREMQVIQWFLEKPWRINEIAEKKQEKRMTIYHLIQRLTLKKVLIMKSRDPEGNNIYIFNEELLKGSPS